MKVKPGQGRFILATLQLSHSATVSMCCVLEISFLSDHLHRINTLVFLTPAVHVSGKFRMIDGGSRNGFT